MAVGIEHGALPAIARAGVVVRFAAGEALTHQGTDGRHCFAILDGEVLVSATTLSGNEIVLARQGPGAFVGQIDPLDRLPRTATVRALTELRCSVLTELQFEGLMLNCPQLALAEIRRLSRELRDLRARHSVRGEDLRRRILQLLHAHTRDTGDRVFRSTRRELACWVGATREAVTRTLRDLERDGWVILGRGQVTLRIMPDRSRPPGVIQITDRSA